MNSKKVAETIQQNREWARAEYETKTKGLIFTKDFQSRQEALMHDALATVGERVMAWILRRSWGEYVLYAIKDDGEPAYQRDCARELAIDKHVVSKAVSYLQRRGYLEDQPKKLYPVISPVLASPHPKNEKLSNWTTFYEDWKVVNSVNFQAYEVANSVTKNYWKVVRADYKKFRKAAKNADVSLLETKKTISETGKRAAVSPLEASNRRHQQAPAKDPVEEGMQTKAQARAFLFDQILLMQKTYPETPFAKPLINPQEAADTGLVQRILDELGANRDGMYDEQHIVGYLLHVTAQFKGWGLGGSRKPSRDPESPTGPKSLGLLVNWARDYARIAGRGGFPEGRKAVSE
jgi:hypothetical protein